MDESSVVVVVAVPWCRFFAQIKTNDVIFCCKIFDVPQLRVTHCYLELERVSARALRPVPVKNSSLMLPVPEPKSSFSLQAFFKRLRD